ncbi:MAG: ceramidase domain-containing protein [Bdellovibrionaceae bacterium]|nr:ceramidase domain-containing protein [Pseudobdellovibrionaceae bacterium]
MSLYDNSKREMTISPGCPWYNAQQTLGAPNVNWCEETSCSYINEPANTWSNLGFLIAAILIIRQFKRSELQLFGWVVFVMGLFSAIYHATNNYGTQHLDFLGMSLMISAVLAIRLKGTIKTGTKTLFAIFLIANLITLGLLDILDLPIQLLLLINAAPIISIDLFLGFKQKKLHQYGSFAIALILLIAAQIFAQIDLKRIYCEPENLIMHGHVAWHILCALAMYFIAKHLNKTTA